MPDQLPDVTFVVNKSGNPSVFQNNFAASPCLQGIPSDRVIVQEGFASASLGYNDAIEKSKTDLIVLAHQDVYFPKDWLSDVYRSLRILEQSDPDWGVLGCSGVNNRGLFAAYLYSVGLGVLGKPFAEPVLIDTLDEFVLIMRKSSILRFDQRLPHFHFYGTDICMSARKARKNCYAISAFSVHNTSYGPLSSDYFRCYWPVKRKWKEYLPIQTTCIRITRWDEEYLIRRFKDLCFNLMGRDMSLRPRLDDPSIVLQDEAVLSAKG